jgi:hypothetical protein
MLAKHKKSLIMSQNRIGGRKRITNHTRMAKSCKPTMTYYQKLLNRVEKATKDHPNRTVVMDARTLEVLAASRNRATIKKAIVQTTKDSVSIIFDPPKVKQIGLLCHW